MSEKIPFIICKYFKYDGLSEHRFSYYHGFVEKEYLHKAILDHFIDYIRFNRNIWIKSIDNLIDIENMMEKLCIKRYNIWSPFWIAKAVVDGEWTDIKIKNEELLETIKQLNQKIYKYEYHDTGYWSPKTYPSDDTGDDEDDVEDEDEDDVEDEDEADVNVETS